MSPTSRTRQNQQIFELVQNLGFSLFELAETRLTVYQLRDLCYVLVCLCHARSGDLQEKCKTQGEDVAYLGVCC